MAGCRITWNDWNLLEKNLLWERISRTTNFSIHSFIFKRQCSQFKQRLEEWRGGQFILSKNPELSLFRVCICQWSLLMQTHPLSLIRIAQDSLIIHWFHLIETTKFALLSSCPRNKSGHLPIGENSYHYIYLLLKENYFQIFFQSSPFLFF